MSKVYAIIGGKGTGKSTFVKERLKQVNPRAIFINDVNQEYTEIKEMPYMDSDDFTILAAKLQNAVIVFEEATIFFGTHSQNKAMKNLLVRSRHTKNTIFLVFHSLRSLPTYIYELINFIILFKTNDNTKVIDSRFNVPELTELSERIKDNNDLHYFEIFETLGNFTHEKN